MSRRIQKPKLGQHFLVDEAIVDRIVELAALPSDGMVLEIGPGKGVLTRALNAAVPDGTVLAVEFDFALVEYLREHASKRVKVVHADALLFDYTTVKSPYHVVSNLPYQITSPILHQLIGSANPPESMTLMMQREVAERLVAAPHTRERGLLTIIVEWYGSVEHAFDVPPEAFNPRPKVWSSVVKLVRFDAPASFTSQIPPNLPFAMGGVPLSIEPETLRVPGSSRPPFQPFLKLLKIGFSQKRRQIHHPFGVRFPMLKDQLDDIFARAGVERTMRAEELSFGQWVKLYGQIQIAIKR